MIETTDLQFVRPGDKPRKWEDKLLEQFSRIFYFFANKILQILLVQKVTIVTEVFVKLQRTLRNLFKILIVNITNFHSSFTKWQQKGTGMVLAE